MLTLFTVPKAFRGHIRVIQRNAIRSWTKISPPCEILLLGDEDGTAELATELQVRHVPSIERNEQGTPTINSIFAEAQAAAKHPHLCYVNADIIFMGEFLPAIRKVWEEFGDAIMVGRRWDVDVREDFDFSGEWEQRLRARVKRTGRRQAPSAIDYLVFKNGQFREIPPFAVGRANWDNWMLYAAASQHAPIVDLSKCVKAVHQSHDYSHHQDGVGVWTGQEAQRNMELAGGRMNLYTILDANYRLTKQGIIRRPIHSYHLYRLFTYYCEKSPFLHPAISLVRWLRNAWLFRGRFA